MEEKMTEENSMEPLQLNPKNAQEILNSLTLTDLAKKSCRKCYGRGYIGFTHNTRKLVLCSCTRKSYSAIVRMVERHNRESGESKDGCENTEQQVTKTSLDS